MFGIGRRRRVDWPNYVRWQCDICGKERDDRHIAVITKPLIINGRLSGCGTENIKYCDDNPDCTQKAKTFSHLAPPKRKE